uniref:Uncharacterized protein n=1 Tax=Anguilla anguilla TaxID=7936 RepID=A0A0E9SX24_ANGAN
MGPSTHLNRTSHLAAQSHSILNSKTRVSMCML